MDDSIVRYDPDAVKGGRFASGHAGVCKTNLIKVIFAYVGMYALACLRVAGSGASVASCIIM
jgi:hypothetical protein